MITNRRNIVFPIGSLVFSMFLVSPTSACASEDDATQQSEGMFIGYAPCKTNSDCPQYSTCEDYVGKCGKKMFGWLVGDCYYDKYLEELYEGIESHCVECSPQDTELIDTGTKLCYWEWWPSCETDEDCSEPGLFCTDSNECMPNDVVGFHPCQTDADCQFGWECVTFPKDFFDPGCFGDAAGDAYSVAVDSDNMCCWQQSCNPRGTLMPHVGCPGSGDGDFGDSDPADAGTGGSSGGNEDSKGSGSSGSNGCGMASIPGADKGQTGVILLLLVITVGLTQRKRKGR